MSPLRLVWLGLALWGAVHPAGLALAWLAGDGPGPLALAPLLGTGGVAAGLAWDAVTAAAALILWIAVEVAVRRNWTALLAIPATLGLGPGCGLPLYLFLRSAPLR
ncbi:MAG: DUF2834 domain-containing protein [Rhodobacteraceae bacterium]|nr:DUF2834 domain-containing protein [Paracoccaceae bacterium]